MPSAYETLDGCDALIVCTEWAEFRHPDFGEVAKHLKEKTIFDGRNIYRRQTLRSAGFTYYCVGRPPVTNLYSSAIFIAWGIGVLSVVLERIFRNGFGSAVAAAAGFCSLLVAHHLAGDGDTMRMLEKHIMLNVVDQNWKEHLARMDYLRQGIHLRGYAQKQPKQEYKKEAFELFSDMLEKVKREVVTLLARVRIRSEEEVAALEAQERAAAEAQARQMQFQHADSGGYNPFSMDEVYRETGLVERAARLGVSIVNLSREARSPIELSVGRRRIRVELPRLLTEEIDLLVTVPVPKMHANSTVSLTFKNQWGCIPEPRDRLRLHPYLAEVLVGLNRAVRAGPAIVDGRFGLTEGGPMRGRAVPLDWVVVTGDIGAGARVTCELMQVPLDRARHLRHARRQGLIPDLADVQLNTDLRPFLRERFVLRRAWTDYPGWLAFRSRAKASFSVSPSRSISSPLARSIALRDASASLRESASLRSATSSSCRARAVAIAGSRSDSRNGLTR